LSVYPHTIIFAVDFRYFFISLFAITRGQARVGVLKTLVRLTRNNVAVTGNGGIKRPLDARTSARHEANSKKVFDCRSRLLLPRHIGTLPGPSHEMRWHLGH